MWRQGARTGLFHRGAPRSLTPDPADCNQRHAATGSYDVVRYASGALCAMAALMALMIRRARADRSGTPVTSA
ncbi:hypothetical protein ACFWBV_03755 [Streptomyces sp. NPDC060030]|uniref:hypothetical protein n=1 Tax=Streptomyces sp. NPDC060030 TaxID=3347042 RepID=UPI0036B75A9C